MKDLKTRIDEHKWEEVKCERKIGIAWANQDYKQVCKYKRLKELHEFPRLELKSLQRELEEACKTLRMGFDGIERNTREIIARYIETDLIGKGSSE